MISWKTLLFSCVVLVLLKRQNAKTAVLPRTALTTTKSTTTNLPIELQRLYNSSSEGCAAQFPKTSPTYTPENQTGSNTNSAQTSDVKNFQHTHHHHQQQNYTCSQASVFDQSGNNVNIAYRSGLQTDTGAAGGATAAIATGSSSTLPLIITPKGDSSLLVLKTFLETNREWLNEQLTRFGVILIRGFDVNDEFDVQSTVQAFQPHLNNNYRGTSPRSTQHGSEYVFSAAEVPSYYPIFQHIEMSFLDGPPRQLFFSALRAPQTTGGETAIADFRKVYHDLPEGLREKLAKKKIMYRRTLHREPCKGFTRDVASLQSWPTVFGTDDKDRILQIAAAENNPGKWTGKDNDTFVSETISDPFQLHPVTNEPVWFNHAQVFHWTTFPAELFFAFRRTGDFRFLWHWMVVGVHSVWKYGVLGHKMGLDASFGDGTPFSVWEAHQIRHAIHKNMVFSRWQKGDILMIDNWSTSHGRQPTYDTGRKVVVAWSDPMEKPNLYKKDDVKQ